MEIKPCPFCGGKAHLGEPLGLYFVQCMECYAAGAYCVNEKDAIDAWNKRTEGNK